MKKKWWSIKAKAKDAEIWIYEEIGDFWDAGVSAKDFAKDMQTIGKVDRIILHLNSPGGIVWDGIAIYNILKQHPAQVSVNIEGLAASIASVVAMAGNEVIMAENAMMMIHDPWGFSMGSADEMRKTADMLDKVKESILNAYVAKSNGKTDEPKFVDLMSAETWMNASEAMDFGLIDSVSESIQLAASFDLSKYKYRNAPQNRVECSDSRQRCARMSIKCQQLRAASGK